MIAARFMRHRITINELSITENDYGEKIETEVPLFTISAEIIDSEKSVSINADGDDVADTKSFRVRYNKNITPRQTLTYKGVKYEIASAENVKGLNKEININAISYL